MVTTRGDEASRSRALAAGASRFMTKPFTPAGLLDEVRSVLAEADTRGDPGAVSA